MSGRRADGAGSESTVPPPDPPEHLPPPMDPWAEPTAVGPAAIAPDPVGPPPVAPQPVAPPPAAPRPVAPPPVAPPPMSPPPGAADPVPPRPPTQRRGRRRAAADAADQSAGAPIARIGEITVTASTVRTPTGDLPLAGSTWQVSDYWHHEEKTPAWAVAAAILGFAVVTVFSLLFLLVKETRHHGTVQVTVTSGQRQYVARIPVRTQDEVHQVNQQVNYVRSLAAR